MNKIYAIKDIVGYAQEIRTSAAKSISHNYTENLDEFITIQQVINLVHKESLGLDDSDRPLLNEEANANIFDAIVVWLHNSAISKLAASNLVECAWDSENNEMVFWTHNQSHTVQKKKEHNNGSKQNRNTKKNKGV